MAVPGLQPHIEFQETPQPQLINRKTGAALLVTAAEARLIHAWDGSASAARLSAAVFTNGFDVDPWQVEQFFRRLERLGCLAVPGPRIPHLVDPKPGVQKLEDKVPCLRKDLLIELAPRSRAVFHVMDPKSNRAFSLLDTEVSVARMLDGKRTVQDALENAARLGIEVTLESLQHFISHLKSYRFIDRTTGEGESTWPAREQWTEEERQLYQASMKMLREGHFAEARSFAESLEAADPTREEAHQLKRRVEAEAEGLFELVGTFGELHGPPKSVPAPAIEAAVPVVAAALPPPAPPAPPRRRLGELVLRRKGVIAGTVLGLALLAVLLRPVQVTTVVACELQVDTLGLPRTMRGGRVAREVEPGARVEKGAVLARLAAGPSLEELGAKVKSLEAALAALPPVTPGKRTELARVGWRKAFEKSRKKGSKAEQRAALRELEAAKRAVDALTHEFSRAALEAELKSGREEKAALEAELTRSIVVAPAAGLFVGVGALPEVLGVNDSFGQIVAPNFRLVTREPLPAGLVSAAFRSGGQVVELGIVEGAPLFPVRPAFVGARGTLEMTTARTPWVASRFR